MLAKMARGDNESSATIKTLRSDLCQAEEKLEATELKLK